ncbi:MAG TPA: RIP metalloprotease RseP [Candidatus Competibacteraceae bacterium]|nr:RIP metalloprotease RseP [Candidatus Competibacteraceae bacterium]
MSDVLLSLLALVITLGLLISFHEFGHFWVARRLGVKVLRFSVGFGKPLWLRRGKVDDTEYAIAAIPLGGYVRMLDEREGPVAAVERHRAFNRQSVWTRIAIVVAGPLCNLLLAVLLYWLVYMLGVSGTRPLLDDPPADTAAAAAGLQRGDEIMAVGGEPTPTLDAVVLALVDHALGDGEIELTVRDATGRSLRRVLSIQGGRGWDEDGQVLDKLGLRLWRPEYVPTIERLVPGGAAERAGLRAGDRLLAANGKPLRNWEEWVEVVRAHPGRAIAVTVERDGRKLELSLTPQSVDDPRLGRIGQIGAVGQVPPEALERLRVEVRYGPVAALGEAVARTWQMSLFTLRMLGRMLVGTASLENLSGPLTIAQYAGQSVSYGLVAFLSFLAVISISLGVLNLLPIPVLDGGHLLYYLIELVKGSPLSETAQNLGQRLGLAVLIMLMGLALFNDLARLLG